MKSKFLGSFSFQFIYSISSIKQSGKENSHRNVFIFAQLMHSFIRLEPSSNNNKKNHANAIRKFDLNNSDQAKKKKQIDQKTYGRVVEL